MIVDELPRALMAESYSYQTAALATGVSRDVIIRAVRAGDLVVSRPEVDGRPIAKPLIPRAELHAWIERGRRNA
ncbi:hypothetical protein ACFQ8T_12600 [Isoptericola sp. NPDC056618]|uniref:hypothetical protein n=1 Tax=Isoptericola sp. NPDC056618 TaxID=3345878 RepID=UPI00367827D7